MKYKLVAVDMDGTLLNSNGLITNETIKAIKRTINCGVKFVISTGRPIQGIKKYNDLLNLQGAMITYNGAMIVSIDDDKVLYQECLKRNDALKILDYGNKINTTICAWSMNKLYVNKLNDKVSNYIKLSGVNPILITDYEEFLKHPITKILFYDTVEGIEGIQKDLQESIFDEVTYCTSQPIFLEFFSSKVSKAKAMEFLGEFYNISANEMIAIGDGLNDLCMIEYAGLGVAMGNATEEVKKHSKYVTTSNDEDGVKEVLDKFILNDCDLNV